MPVFVGDLARLRAASPRSGGEGIGERGGQERSFFGTITSRCCDFLLLANHTARP